MADVESVVLGDNATTLFVGELSAVQASVMPESIKYNQFEVESSDPSVAGIVTKQVGENVVNFVRGNKPGKATITVRSVLDKTKAATYEVEVKEGVNTSALKAALADARALNAAAYTEESYAKLAEAVRPARSCSRAVRTPSSRSPTRRSPSATPSRASRGSAVDESSSSTPRRTRTPSR